MAAKKSKENANLLDVASDLISGKKVDLGAVVDLAAQAISESSEKKSKTSSKKKKEDDNLISQLFQEVVNYPQFSEKDYWSIREFFQKNTPDEVTASVLENITGLEKEAVTDYLVPALALLGLVKEGKPTNTLKSWINNAKYVKTCLSIAETVYPETLRKLGCKTEEEQKEALKWFVKNAKVSTSTAKKMLGVYMLFADPKLKDEADKKATAAAKEVSSALKKAA